ncbi:hypothetical protein CKM354_000345400 [Cercospora kikuchii]|uniref:Methyltransferase domain-containing protein n=1 Tax=Cercospora kikuchii TaxID=84275 RepID=A0A9P3CE80_9PEZI|nr:uncharacterized protein CKM354_000345400 [Cercospora kikuchii]GIZ40101.1 hypothetical protein CKM354_000345400 [Cercospora kikuchii]
MPTLPLTKVDEHTESTNLGVYFTPGDPQTIGPAREVLVKYSGVPEDEVVSHVRKVRDEAWKVFKYPCVGNYYFLEFSVSKSENYSQVLERVRGGETLLDLACCFGHNIRKLIHDGAPATSVFGSELEPEFIDLGFQLFKDRDNLATNFVSGDFFGEDVGGLAGRQFDIIHAASFFHLFSWDDQVEAVSRSVRLLKPKAGSMLFGRQTAVKKAKEVQHPANIRSGNMFRHDVASFKEMVRKVGEKTGTHLEASVEQQEGWEELEKAHGWHRITFQIVLQ